jgi:hypothetical protein
MPKNRSNRVPARHNPAQKQISQYFSNSSQASSATVTTNSAISQQQSEIINRMISHDTPEQERWSMLMKEIFEIKNSSSSLLSTVGEHENRLSELEDCTNDHASRINDIEQVELNKCMEITGLVIPKDISSDLNRLRAHILSLLRGYGILFRDENILFVGHFTRSFNNEPVDIIKIKFLDPAFKYDIMRQKKNPSNIYFQHVLTKENRFTFMAVKRKAREGLLKKPWIINGQIFTSYVNSNKRIRVHDLDQLEIILNRASPFNQLESQPPSVAHQPSQATLVAQQQWQVPSLIQPHVSNHDPSRMPTSHPSTFPPVPSSQSPSVSVSSFPQSSFTPPQTAPILKSSSFRSNDTFNSTSNVNSQRLHVNNIISHSS